MPGEYLSSPSGARAKMNRQNMCHPSGAQVFVHHLTEASRPRQRLFWPSGPEAGLVCHCDLGSELRARGTGTNMKSTNRPNLFPQDDAVTHKARRAVSQQPGPSGPGNVGLGQFRQLLATGVRLQQFGIEYRSPPRIDGS